MAVGRIGGFIFTSINLYAPGEDNPDFLNIASWIADKAAGKLFE